MILAVVLHSDLKLLFISFVRSFWFAQQLVRNAYRVEAKSGLHQEGVAVRRESM